MKILVINAGSSSLKFQLLESKQNFLCLYKGIIDGIGLKNCFFIGNHNKIKTRFEIKIGNHKEALNIALKIMLKSHIIKNLKEIDAVGHRVVHGGEKYKNATIINPEVIKTIRKLCTLAPLHNPPNLATIEACQKILPKTPQVAVFDTAFHQTLPEKAYLYALPYPFYKNLGIRRYGFHGTSHAYITKETNKLLKKRVSKIVICHLGNGSSITAVKNGKSIDTSMGFTPLEGIPMGTRSGDLDPAIALQLIQNLKKSPQEIAEILNHDSGLKGVSGISSDVRDLWAATKKHDQRAIKTLNLLAYKTARYIGAYTAALNGLDALIFTAGIGENAYYLRQEICNYFNYLNLKLDPKKNKKNAVEISTKTSKVKVYVIPTNEEKQIAQETYQILKNA